jgi:hypothetical protein
MQGSETALRNARLEIRPIAGAIDAEVRGVSAEKRWR